MANLSTGLKGYLGGIEDYRTASPRLTFVYSVLSTRKHINPTGFNSAINWWKQLLIDLNSRGLLNASDDRLILQVDESLRERLRWNGIGKPSSLGTIINELQARNDLTPLNLYLSNTSSTSLSLLALLAKPITWTYSLLRQSIVSDLSTGEAAEERMWESRKGDWVVNELVERASRSAIAYLSRIHIDSISRCYTIKSFHQTIRSQCLPDVILSERDCLVLAKYLSRDPSFCVMKGEVIKFSIPSSSATSPLIITQSDEGILSLVSTISALTSQIAHLESQILDQRSKLSQYSATQQPALVKSHLIRRKQLEIILGKRIGARDSLGEVLFSIEKAVGDEETMNALALGTKTLQTLISSPALSLSHIEATTTALSDSLADAEEINLAINEGGLTMGAEQNDEVEEELRQLVAEVEQAEESRRVEARAKLERDTEIERDKRVNREEEKRMMGEKRMQEMMEKLSVSTAPTSATTGEVQEESGLAEVNDMISEGS